VRQWSITIKSDASTLVGRHTSNLHSFQIASASVHWWASQWHGRMVSEFCFSWVKLFSLVKKFQHGLHIFLISRNSCLLSFPCAAQLFFTKSGWIPAWQTCRHFPSLLSLLLISLTSLRLFFYDNVCWKTRPAMLTSSCYMNRLNQTEPATFSILPCWAFFRDSVFIYYLKALNTAECALYKDMFCK
jgi:hypothetical protein